VHLESVFPISSRLPILVETHMDRHAEVTFPVINYDLPAGDEVNPMLVGLSAAPGTHHGMKVGTTGFQRADRKNALACETTAQARQLIELLGLDDDRWSPLGIGQALLGHQFEKAVVLYRAKDSLVAMEQAVSWIGHLRSKSESLVLV
jgi:hypothetical protein